MARSVLDIVIKLSKQGQADRETVKALVQVKSGLAQVGMVAGVVTGALFAAKKAMDFGKEGAQLEFIDDRFNRLSASIGSNDALLGQLRVTTRGLYSDTELMASASDLMGLGLAKNEDELLRLQKVAAGLNMNMNQLVLTLTNQTTMRFDALGVSVDGFKEKVAGLQKAGMDANAAFKEAFLEQAEAQLEKVGEAADSDIGSFMRFEAGLKNIGDQAKKSFAEGIEPLVGGLADLLESEAAASKTAQDHAKYIELAKEKLKEETGQVNIATSQAAGLARQLEMNANKSKAVAEYYDHMAKSLKDAGDATTGFSTSLDTVKEIIAGPIAKAQEDYKQQLSDLQTELADLQEQENAYFSPPVGSKKYDELQDKIAGVKDRIDQTTESYKEQARQIMFNIDQEQILASSLTTEQQAEAIAALGKSMGMWDEQTSRAIEVSSVWTKRLAEGSITSEEYARVMSTLGGSIFGVGVKAATSVEPVDEMTNSVNDLGEKTHAADMLVNGLRGQMDQLDGKEVTATVNIQVNGSVPKLTGMRTTNLGGRGGGQGGEFAGMGMRGFAGGGLLNDALAIVGERGWEAVVRNRDGSYTVIPHDVSSGLAKLGLLAGAPTFMTGGTYDPGYYTGPTRKIGSLGHSAADVVRSGRRINRRESGAGGLTVVDASAMTASQPTAQTVAPLVQVTEQAVASVQAAQVVQTMEGRQTRATLNAGNNQLSNQLAELIQETKRLNKTLPTALKTAVQQIMG